MVKKLISYGRKFNIFIFYSIAQIREEIEIEDVSLETSQEIIDKKFKKIHNKLQNYKQQHGNKIAELWQGNEYLFFFYRNEYLREKLRDMEDRSRPDNLRIDDLKEVVNETLEQAKEILKRMISE